MAKFNFTETRIKGLQPPAAGEETHSDTAVPGLCVRVRSTGSRSYFVRYALGDRDAGFKRYTIGAPEAVRLAEARTAAAKVLAEVRQGRDPAAERDAGAARMTVAALVDLHIADQKARRVATAPLVEKMLKRDFVEAVGANCDPATLTRAQLVGCIDKVRDGIPGRTDPRPGSVSSFRARLHGVLETALRRGVIQANPLGGYRQPRRSKAERLEQAERAKGRMLTMPEVASLWRACGDERISPAFGAYVRSLIVLGTRRGETAAARLAWVTAATPDSVAMLTIPARETKNGREHVVPLPSLIGGVIAAVPRYQGVDFLFPGGRSRKTGRLAGISGWSKLWPRLLRIAGEYGFDGHLEIHDLRKSARSHWRRLGVAVDVCEAMLNHTSRDMLIDIYDLNEWLPEKIEAMDKWCAEIEQALGNAPAADVVAIHRIHAAKRHRYWA
jgi:integrase